jgi:spermidine synthase
MNKKAFLLGFYSIGGQVLLLRELVAAYNGDELFIGTALFGWLLAVAAGAVLFGRKYAGTRSGTLFIIGGVVLPVSILAIRFSPLCVSTVLGEVIPFTKAAAISILLTWPVGFISGALFPVISREGHRPSATIARVYLFEGIGAFAGGVAVTALAGPILSGLTMVLALSILTVAFYYMPSGKTAMYATSLTILTAIIILKYAVPWLDKELEKYRFKGYQIEYTFDTPYGNQTIISRDSTVVLLTDNKIETAFPDPETAENQFLPPLLYRPTAKNILCLGRAEAGISQLAEYFPDIDLLAVDSRGSLNDVLDKTIPGQGDYVRVENDPVAYLRKGGTIAGYDIIILNTGEPDSYRNSRYLTDRFLRLAGRHLAPGGIIFIPTRYDTDRYISSQKKEILSILYNTFRSVSNYVHVWPGTSTLFFLSNDSIFNLSPDSLISRVKNLPYKPAYISPDFLHDRLDQFKANKLFEALKYSQEINCFEKPILVHRQNMYRSSMMEHDEIIMSLLKENRFIILVLPATILILFAFATGRRYRRRTYGLFLYFGAGLLSLSIELISFYAYQSSAGSLYSEIGILIGSFMFGLAFGTYFSIKSEKENLEYPALLMFLTATFIFLMTYRSIEPKILLYFYILFLFTTAMATGSLFVAATRRYYYGRVKANRGLGYGSEIVGSSVGALWTLTILLPIIGFRGLLISIIIAVIILMAGAYITE